MDQVRQSSVFKPVGLNRPSLLLLAARSLVILGIDVLVCLKYLGMA